MAYGLGIFQSPKTFFRGRNFLQNPGFSAERAIFVKFQAPKFRNSEPEKMQFHTPSHSIPPLDSLLHMAAHRPAHNTPIHMDFLYVLLSKAPSPWIGMLWAGLRGRHVDHPCGWQTSPWPARQVTDKEYKPLSECGFAYAIGDLAHLSLGRVFSIAPTVAAGNFIWFLRCKVQIVLWLACFSQGHF